MTGSPKNIQASIHQRLLNESKASARAFNDVVMYYAIERFLYRLAQSPHAKDIVLKGGFSDVITPGPEPITYPSVLDHPPARLLAYNRETVIAEKFEAMVKLGELNSRMKDFFDVYVLAQNFAFDGPAIADAIQSTFARRGTAIEAHPACFEEAFSHDETKQQQWKGFLKTSRVDQAPPRFAEVIGSVAGFLSPVAVSLADGQRWNTTWSAGGPWKPETP